MLGRHSTGIALALYTWCAYGAMTGTNDLRAFTLQHRGVEAVVERKTFDLRGSPTPRLEQQAGDTFRYEGKLLAAKQPGQFMLGALPYAAVRAVGISYREHYDLAAALTTWLSSGALAASAVFVVWHLLSSAFGFAPAAASVAAVCYGLGSTITAYAGVLHHDVMASALLLWALWFIENALASGGQHLVFVGGVLCGLTLCTSFLAAPVTATLLVYAALAQLCARRGWRERIRGAVLLSVGFLIGTLPLAAYNWRYFGNPLVQANVAGNFNDTFFAWNERRFFEHVRTYLGLGELSIWKYAPLVAAGFWGVLAFPSHLARQRAFIVAATLIHFAYILNIQTLGDCQYGPRYSFPLQGLAVLGVARLHGLTMPNAWLHGLVYAALYNSIVINGVGALGGTMFCSIATNAFVRYATDWSSIARSEHPLWKPALALFLVFVAIPITRSAKRLLSKSTPVATQASR